MRELKGFERVELVPGEEKNVTFTLDGRAFAYYEVKIHDWFVESGEFEVEIGSSSRDIRLIDTVTLTGTKELPIHYTAMSTIGDMVKSAAGRAILEKLMGGSEKSQHGSDSQLKHMGEGAERTAEQSMMGMPLQSVVTFGRMTQQQLDSILQMLNGGGNPH